MNPSSARSSALVLTKVLDLSRRLNAERDLPAILVMIAKEAASLLEADRATIFMLDHDKRELWSQVTLDGEAIRFDARLGLAGACAMTRQVINVVDAQEDPRFHASVDARTKYRTRSVLTVPLLTTTGDCVGVFQTLNKKEGIFTAEDEATAKLLAAQAVTAIETASVLEALSKEQKQLQVENAQLWREVEGRLATENILGTSARVQSIVRLIDQIRETSVDVLITGESGTGKELVAKAIHYNSPRARRPFVAMNCAALPDNLLESELFGIERGVATGVERRIGKFEEAQGGTLFLDEVGELSLAAQAKILRVLQERVLDRVGGRTPVPVDVRIVAATNVDLETAVKKSAFRQDLYYRLKVVTIETPPLREIPEDIPLLAKAILEKFCRAMGKEGKRVTNGALQCLMRYPWPGNVRELENEVKRIVASVRKAVVAEDDLAEHIRAQSTGGPAWGGKKGRSLKSAVEELEKRMIGEALDQCRQNQLQAARLLGLSRQGLIKKMKRYGIKLVRLVCLVDLVYLVF